MDPLLTLSCPPSVTASSGLDALTQCLEPYVSPRANPATDALAAEGLRRGARALRRAYQHGDDPNAREEMALCSLFGGIALANAQLGAVHGIAGVVGAMIDAPPARCAPRCSRRWSRRTSGRCASEIRPLPGCAATPRSPGC